MPFTLRRASAAGALLVCTVIAPLRAQDSTDARNALPPSPQPAVSGLRFRFIGPVGNRIPAVAGIPGDPLTYYAGAASGGIWKTVDGGAHWTPIFDHEPVMSIGALAVAPSNPNIVWAGTGEPFIRSNVSIGWGVYKSTDAGATWTCMGLERTARIARVVIDPRDPNRVFVAAEGHGYGLQPERGIFRTTDGGTTWTRVLFVNDSTGASDLVMDPNNPDVLYAGMWQFALHTWNRTSGGTGSGIWKSTDGGTTWHRLTGHGLPSGPVGKVGLAMSRANSNRVYALIETGDGVPRNGVPQDSGRLWRSDDAGATWTLVSSDRQVDGRTAYYNRMAVAPDNPDQAFFVAAAWAYTLDGGHTIITPPRPEWPQEDEHDIWIDPTNGNRMVVGHDHGVAISVDRGHHWQRIELPVAQIYHVTVDNRIPYWVYGNVQDDHSVMGPSDPKLAPDWTGPGIPRGLWRTVGGDEDGWATPDPVDTNLVWSSGSGYGSVGGAVNQYDVRTGYSHEVEVWPKEPIGSPASAVRYRFDWTFPLTISPHDHNRVYVGSQYVHVTTDGGQTWHVISPDLTRNDKSHQQASGGLTPENIGVEYGDVIFAIAESPRVAGLIWVGTNDGLVQLTRDGGKTWTNVSGNIPQLVPWSTISNIEPSDWDPGIAYITVDAHQENNRDPWVYKTTDYGKTWTLITNGLPHTPLSYAHVIRQDPARHGLLYLGTENGLYVSHDDGAHWSSLQLNLPHAPVYWLTVQKRFGDLVVATYGRGFWILDDLTPIREFTTPAASSSTSRVRLFPPRLTYRFRTVEPPLYHVGDPTSGEQPPYGAPLNYWIAPNNESDRSANESVTFTIRNAAGAIVRTLHGPAHTGVNRIWWDLESEPTTEARIRVSPEYASWFSVPDTGRAAPGIGRFALLEPPGRYTVTLQYGDVRETQPLTLEKDPASGGRLAAIETQMHLLRGLMAEIDSACARITTLENLRAAIAAMRERSGESLAAAVRDSLMMLDQQTLVAERVLFQTRVTNRGQDFLRWPMRVTEQLLYLADNIAGSDYAPTAAQQAVAAELHGELTSALATANRIVRRDLPRYNAMLLRHRLQPLTIITN